MMFPGKISDRGKLCICLFLKGWACIWWQTVLLREVLSSFFGNEFSVSMALGMWLAGGTTGSLAFRHFSRRESRDFLYLTFLEGVLIILGLLIIRVIPGKIAGPGQVFSLTVFFLLCLFSLFLTGFLEAGRFVLAGKLLGNAGVAYGVEGSGWLAGGLVLAFFLWKGTNPFFLISTGSLLNLFSCFLLSYRLRKIILATTFFWLGVIAGSPFLENYSLKKQWPGSEIIRSGYSSYGSFVVLGNLGQKVLLRDGIVFFSSQADYSSLASTVFLPLCFQKKTESILISGNPELINYARRTGARKIVFLEPDRLAVRILKDEFLPEEWQENLKVAEPIRYLKITKEKFDLIILDQGLPLSLGSGRFYSKDFFLLLGQHLKEEGILALVVPGVVEYLNQALRKLHGVVYRTASRVFPFSRLALGEPILYLFSYRDIFSSWKTLPEGPGWLKEEFLGYVFDPLKEKNFLQSLKENTLPGRKDSGLETVYYSLAYWLGITSSFLGQFFTSFFDYVLSFQEKKWVLVIFFLALWLFPGNRKRCTWQITFTNGLVSLSLEVIIFLLFQWHYGQLYLMLSLLTGMFMAGLSAGGIISAITKPVKLALLKAEKCYLLFHTLAFLFVTGGIFSGWLAGFLLVVSGFLLGWEFGLLMEFTLWQGFFGSLGLLYGADLAGALVACLLTPLVFLPSLGFSGCLFLLVCLKLATFLSLRHQLF